MLLEHLEVEKISMGRFEDIHDLKRGAYRGVVDTRNQVPSLEKAHDLCRALGYDLRIVRPSNDVSNGDPWTIIGNERAVSIGGLGAVNGPAHRINHLAFHKEWLKGMKIDPDEASLLRCSGNAMSPTLPADAVVLVDHRIMIPEGTELFAFVRGKELLIRRVVYRAGRALTILCDNPQFHPEILTGEELDDIRILGKVRWTGHEAF